MGGGFIAGKQELKVKSLEKVTGKVVKIDDGEHKDENPKGKKLKKDAIQANISYEFEKDGSKVEMFVGKNIRNMILKHSVRVN